VASWDLKAIADQLHDAALDPTIWPRVLSALGKTVGAEGAVLFSTEARLPGIPMSSDVEDLMESYFKDRWNIHDERYRGVPAMLQKGVMSDTDVLPHEGISQSPFYQDLLERHGFRGFAGIGFEVGGDLWCIAIQRKIRQGFFEPIELSQLKSLCRPFADAAAISRQIGFARVLGISDAFSLIRQPALLLDHRARVLTLNAIAEHYVDKVFSIVDRELVFNEYNSHLVYINLLKESCYDQVSENTKPAVSFVKDPSGNIIPIRIVSLRSWSRFTFANARLLLLLGYPKTAETARETLVQAFKLTNAEAQLANKLATGKSLQQAAQELALSYETARTRLKVVYSKTSTHRQNELVALVLRLLRSDPNSIGGGEP